MAIDAALDRTFDYAIPESLAARAVPGARVSVTFGRRVAVGYIVALSERSDWSAQSDPSDPSHPRSLKALLSVEGERPFILPGLIDLARWIAAYYCAPLEICIRGVMPAPVRDGRSRDRERFFVDLVKGAPEEALTARQRGLLADIRRVEGGWLHALCAEFACAPETLRRLAAAGCLTIEKRVQRRDPLANRRVLPTQPLSLMPAQAAALEMIRAAGATPPPKPVLLFGVTGSGKTEVYLQAIAEVLSQDRGAIVLVPEIALTPQTVQRFAGRFGERIAVLHSALSDGERHDEWHRIRKGEARVVIGPRSAVFAPVERLGLIVVDEEHEPSYKQEEAPRYHARDVAVMRGHIERCAVLLGSATPSLESWRNVRLGKYRLARLERRADDCAMPLVQVVDMRVEAVRQGHAQLLSRTLLDAMQARLERGEQIILFLNRRGYATAQLCPACGYVATCEACNVAFTYHRTGACLRCHICGAWQHPPAVCPACGDPSFKFAGFGTQRLENIVGRCFPQARLARMDADATARKLSHDDILGAFRAGRTDILIGTQMIAKGLHFPNVTLVGIVMADSSLHLPDFRAGERTFQLLAQVAGRSGRGATPGEVVVQTYTPDHAAVTAARTEDFVAFAEQELPRREALGYPPFVRLACLTIKGRDEERTAATAQRLALALRRVAAETVRVSEASPAPLAKANNLYRFQIIARAPGAAALVAALRRLPAAEKLPPDVALAIDIDAISIL